MNKENQKKITSIGGQALIEGIMMKGPYKTMLAVRNPNGEIELEELKLVPLKEKYPVLGWPLIRGVVNFIESMKTGYKALALSAEKAGFEEEEEPSKFEKWLDKTFGSKVNGIIMGIGGVLGVVLAIALFFLLPTWFFNLLQRWLGDGLAPWRSVLEGVMRIFIFILYVVLCAFMPDIKRVFQYHGAEHKTIFCYEADEELTVENVRKYKRFHPRCGTSFIFLTLAISILVYTILPINSELFVVNFGVSQFVGDLLRICCKIIFLPIVVGISYELIRIAGRYDNILTRIISAPGLAIQHLTTKEPEDEMIEVAIASMKPVLPEKPEDAKW